MQENSYKLIQVCDWLTALLSSVVKSVKCKLHHINRCHKTRQVSSLPNALATGLKLQKLRVNWQSLIFAHRQV